MQEIDQGFGLRCAFIAEATDPDGALRTEHSYLSEGRLHALERILSRSDDLEVEILPFARQGFVEQFASTKVSDHGLAEDQNGAGTLVVLRQRAPP
jgi:hypothetical protein